MNAVLEVLDFDSYRKLLVAVLEQKGRGSVSSLARELQCHPTFVSQVAKGKADFSSEQAFRFGKWIPFTGDAFDSFLLLHQWERAGSTELKQFLKQRLNQFRQKREDLKSRWQQKDILSSEVEILYYSHPLFQIVHAAVQIPKLQQIDELSKQLGVGVSHTLKILRRLEGWGLVREQQNKWKALETSLHLSKNSLSIASFHSLWRQVVQARLQQNLEVPGIHYSAIACVDAATADQVKKILLNALDASRKVIEPSPSREAYVLTLDFFRHL
jgi:hypothetical protein